MNLAKSNVALLIAVVVLAVPTILQLRSEAESFVDLSRVPLLFDGFTPDNVGFIALGQPKKEQAPVPANPQTPNQKPPVQYDQLFLQRTDKGWAIAQPGFGQPPNELAGVPVSKDRVENDVFAHLGKIRVDRQALVQTSATPEQLTEFGLDQEHATLIKVTDKTGQQSLAELFVGREAAGALTGTEAVKGVFVRKTDSTDVVLYEYDKMWRRDVAADQWIDKVLFKIESDKATRVSLRNVATAGKTFVFTRSENKASWQAAETPEGRGAVRQSEIEALLQRLRWVSAQDFRMPLARASNLAQLGLLPPQIELEVGYKEGDVERTVKVAVGNKLDDKNEYYLTCSENGFLMTWPAGMVTPFEVNVAEAWFDPAAPTDPAVKKEEQKPDEKKD